MADNDTVDAGLPSGSQFDDVLDTVVGQTNDSQITGDQTMGDELAEQVTDNDNDIDSTAFEELVEADIRSQSVIMQEHQANAESAFALVNHAGGRKFAKEDAIEAAATEMILQLNS